MLIAFLLLAALALAFANGANDNFKATATLYGSGNLAYDPARRLATVAQISGSLASVIWAQALLRAFGGKGLVPDSVVGDPTFLAAVGAGAAVTVLFATRIGLPISTTHALVGGLAGAADQDLALFGYRNRVRDQLEIALLHHPNRAPGE